MDMQEPNQILDWLANGGRLRILRELRTNGGQVFRVGETLRLTRIEPTFVDHSYAFFCESEGVPGKTICIQETQFDAILPL